VGPELEYGPEEESRGYEVESLAVVSFGSVYRQSRPVDEVKLSSCSAKLYKEQMLQAGTLVTDQSNRWRHQASILGRDTG
jgi:hypothetical protein